MSERRARKPLLYVVRFFTEDWMELEELALIDVHWCEVEIIMAKWHRERCEVHYSRRSNDTMYSAIPFVQVEGVK